MMPCGAGQWQELQPNRQVVRGQLPCGVLQGWARHRAGWHAQRTSDVQQVYGDTAPLKAKERCVKGDGGCDGET